MIGRRAVLAAAAAAIPTLAHARGHIVPAWAGYDVKPSFFDRRWPVGADHYSGYAPPAQSVHDWVRAHITSVPPDGVWQRPDVTARRRAGACIDAAILTRAMLLRRGVQPDLVYVVIGHDQRAGDHALVWLEGRVLDTLAPRIVSVADYGDLFRPLAAYGSTAWLYEPDRRYPLKVLQ